jgi:GntR family transcriptional regulator
MESSLHTSYLIPPFSKQPEHADLRGQPVLGPAKRQEEADLPRRIAREILTYIRDQHLTQGDQLPPQTVLAKQLNVSRTSLREALARLQAEGLIKQVHGVGTFVSDDPFSIKSSTILNLNITGMIREQGMEPGTSEVTVSLVKVADIPQEMAACLDLGSADQALHLCRVRTADGQPFAYVVSYVVSDLAGLDTTPDAYQGSMYEYLLENCRQFITKVEAAIEACVADEVLSEKLEVPLGTSLLALHQCHYNTDDRAIITSIDYYVQNPLKLKVIRKQSGFRFLQKDYSP